jgi:hypothetical protein
VSLLDKACQLGSLETLLQMTEDDG